MKIGIISMFTFDETNYGNNLQAYALNRYLRNCYSDFVIESIPTSGILKKRRTNLPLSVLLRIKKYLRVSNEVNKKKSEYYAERRKKFIRFADNNICMPKENNITWKYLLESDYDLFIVGSDVVWCQWDNFIIRERFLDFRNQKDARKISYGASFGRDYIPVCNRRYIRKALQSFSAISVREGSSVEFLRRFGVDGAVHVCDSTMLLTEDDWIKIEKRPSLELVNGSGKIDNGKVNYIFVYLLGTSAQTWTVIVQFSLKNNLKLVTIPQVPGYKSENIYSDYVVPTCSPEEWVWLVHHAAYVITDSFHGTVFSTIFGKKFLVVQREGNTKDDINGKIGNRLIDYLKTINQTDKLCESRQIMKMTAMKWNYADIRKRMDKFITVSKQYIEKNI